MACGTPVLTSTTSSLPEVVGEAGLTVDPTDEAAIADALSALLLDPARRARMAAAGLLQAARFHWDSTARETLSVYRRVLNGA
jgi:glycosyltransferase involved in cell wall biosynthesis